MKATNNLETFLTLNNLPNNLKNGQQLIAAVDARSLRTVQELLTKDEINVNWAEHESGNTALHVAITKDLPEIAKTLVMAGADVDAVNAAGITPLDIARQNGHIHLIDFLQKEKLIKAVTENDVATIRVLLSQNVDPNFVEDEDNITPLHFAALNGALAAAQLLITAGANSRALNIEGKSPLDVAKLHGHQEMVEFLVKTSIDFMQT